jgi:hypothetical protein
MTLILGMSKPEGIYVCVDYRITDARTSAIVDDAATKCLTVHYPPLPGGTKALLAFTGVAVLPDGTPTMTWIRETLRGESELPDQSLAHLRDRLDRDYARLRQPLIINILALHGERRFFGGLSNLRAVSPPSLLSSFGYMMQEVDTNFLFANGQAAARALADEKLAKMQSLLGVVPRKVDDYMRLLAIVNRRVAARERSVSPFCKVSFINADDRFSATSQAFVEHGETVPFEMSIILAGIDLTDIAHRLSEAVHTARSGGAFAPSLDPAEMNEQLKRRS